MLPMQIRTQRRINRLDVRPFHNGHIQRTRLDQVVRIGSSARFTQSNGTVVDVADHHGRRLKVSVRE